MYFKYMTFYKYFNLYEPINTFAKLLCTFFIFICVSVGVIVIVL